jgi:nitrite reductase (NO-forming)
MPLLTNRGASIAKWREIIRAGSSFFAAAVLLAIVTAPPVACASVRSFTLTVQRKHVGIGGGMTFNAWTYDGRMPGPVLKVVQGDEVRMHLTNDTKDAHGVDVHAAQISPDHFSGDPMKPVNYTFTANVPGVFIYHCTAAPILDHIASGMYGMMIVEPKGGWPSGNAQEITIVQGEIYGLPDAHGFIVGSHGKIVQARPDFVVFNGALNKYSVDHPIEIKVGKLVRVYFVNAGPSLTSAFYVSGVLFDTVYKSGNPANAFHGLNTLAVPPSDGAVFEFKVTQPGYYQFVDQNRSQQYKGANGVFHAVQ